MITIDAKDKKLGRVASEAAKIILGKNSPSFVKNKVTGDDLTITNVSKLDINEKKMSDKSYVWYTGFRGGLKEKTMETIINEKGYGEILRMAIYGMLPKNKLTKDRMKKLKIID